MPTTGSASIPPRRPNSDLAIRRQSCLWQIPQPAFPSLSTRSKCIADKGCTVCVDVCPLDVLRISELTGKAYMKYDECWYCMPCEADCPTGAVSVNIPYLLK